MQKHYEERIARYRIFEREDETDPHRRASLQLHGIDPDNFWRLIWSFDKEDDANTMLANMREKNTFSWVHYKLVDAGESEIVKRPAWF